MITNPYRRPCPGCCKPVAVYHSTCPTCGCPDPGREPIPPPRGWRVTVRADGTTSLVPEAGQRRAAIAVGAAAAGTFLSFAVEGLRHAADGFSGADALIMRLLYVVILLI